MAISSPPNRVASPPPPPPTPGLGGPFAILFLVAVFAVIAAVVYLNNGNPEIRRIDLVAQQYADAWSKGSLSDVDYDRLSGPNVDAGDGGKVEAAVQTIVRDLDVTGKGEIKPVKVEVDRGATRITDAARTLATTRLNVTWELQKSGLSQKGHEWTYAVDLTERQDGGRWRVVWTPQTVHPVIRAGLVLRVQRTLAPRAQVIGAGDTPLPPAGSPDLAKAVLGSIATRATQDQADLAPLRAAPSDTIGVAGLQDLYDARLAGNAAITVTAAPAKSGTGIVPNQVPLFVGPPETPTPLQLTLDARVQGWAEAALAGARGAATLVVARPSTGNCSRWPTPPAPPTTASAPSNRQVRSSAWPPTWRWSGRASRRPAR